VGGQNFIFLEGQCRGEFEGGFEAAVGTLYRKPAMVEGVWCSI
jgi:hypothetical protein